MTINVTINNFINYVNKITILYHYSNNIAIIAPEYKTLNLKKIVLALHNLRIWRPIIFKLVKEYKYWPSNKSF